MKTVSVLFISTILSTISFAQSAPRPRITGIDHVAFYTTNPDGVKKLYSDILGVTAAAPIESGETTRYMSGKQWVGYSAAPDPKATDRMDHVAFTTDNIAGLRRYLTQKGLKPGQIQGRSDHSLSFAVDDPEGHHVEFVERAKDESAPAEPNAVSRRMIHAGFLVYNRAAADHFYREVLGFRPYWHGGMKDNETDWVSLQVPDGTDWLEYMIVGTPDGRGIPPTLTAANLGVLNHFSLGVASTAQAYTLLWNGNRLDDQSNTPKIGRDAKWQLNLLDPDGTRAEIMEFHAVGTPCCSPFTASDPQK